MKKIHLLVLAIVALTIMQSCNESKPLELNVMSFNIRYDNPEDSLNNWKYRKDGVVEAIKSYSVDILGTQEVLSNQMADLKEKLPEYAAVGVGRQDGISKGEYSALFYKKDKFKEHDSGTFWLSETPEVVGSKGWDGACERIATWAILEDIATGKKVFAINTHLDHVGQQARIKGVALMLERALKVGKGYPVILTGDFNAEPNSDVVQHVIDEKTPNSLISSRDHAVVKKDHDWTFHDFGRWAVEDRSYLDYIFVSKTTEVLEYEVLQEKLNDVYLSDHNPIFAKIRIN